jgi:hypothetical protein
MIQESSSSCTTAWQIWLPLRAMISVSIWTSVVCRSVFPGTTHELGSPYVLALDRKLS